MTEIEVLEQEMAMLKAKAAKADLRLRIAKMKAEVDKMEEHILLQDEIIKKAEEALNF